ncbi:Lactococcin-G-processing and transport ATP-binding protein LagD [Seminavis robusta]|uniref:Lactococcin-G-processing and transport ATP-binding protein LagD n=1 Tax=Seminavis robusta TaxID=568900 RepID=A0A9N8DM42_9STRA|nr:Lactococcin-G-processing and transport ATP-binding protein LagD [Seminavis robusta]|eukprot:Sro156_g070990.1 Lactococcin-G-processing and transport ATP-binding protein LagD (540) ;mRNA; r:102999-104618
MSNNVDNQHNFMLGLWGVFVIFLADEVVFYILSAMVAKMIAHASKRIQSEIVHGVLDGDASFERKHRPATLANVFTAGIAKLENVWDFCLMEAVFSFFSLISALFFLSLYNFGYTIFVLTAIPFLASLKPMETQAVTASDQSDQANAELFGRFQNTIHLRRAAQVGNRRDFVANRFHNPLLEEAAGHNFWSWLWSYVVVAVYSTVGSALYMVTTIIFLLLLSKGEIDSGEFFAVTSFVYGVLEPIEALGRVSGQVVQNAGAVRQVQRILDDARKSGREDTGNKAKNANPQTEQALTLKKQLEFDNVKFSYTPNGPLILKGVSFSIPAGSYVAVLGSSGSGKSTLLSLLMGIQTAQEGSIRMDGTAISTVSLDTLRDSLAVVFQETFVLDGTVFDNISFGCNATMEQVVHAAKQASVHEVIEKLPEKYDTILGKESAISMSGGQLQRICGIARAVVQGKALLLLDEATSALDAITEHKFIETVEQLRDEGLTVISITHHPSTARNADMILVLDKGIVVETGAYSELIDGGGLFSRLASAS